MSAHAVPVVGTEYRCPDVLSVRLGRPDGYEFVAGQYLTLTLETVAGSETKPFSHSSATGDPYLEITTRLSGSSFKNALAELAPDDRVRIAGPAGRLALPSDERRVAFLVGGVGITPVISMLRSQNADEAPRSVLFYGNRSSSCVPFSDELAVLERRTRLGVVHVLESPPEDWTGEQGFITADLVRRHIDVAEDWLFVVTGPPVMVEAMERCLDALGIPASRRLIERFGPPSRS